MRPAINKKTRQDKKENQLINNNKHFLPQN